MSEKAPTNERPILVPRAIAEGMDPADRMVQVWNLTDELSSTGKQIAYSQEGEWKDGEYGIPEKPIGTDTLSDAGQEALAREYTGKALRGDTILAPIDGVVQPVTLGDYYTNPADGSKYVGVFDKDGKHIGAQTEYVEIAKQKELELAQAEPEHAETVPRAQVRAIQALGREAAMFAGIEVGDEELDKYARVFRGEQQRAERYDFYDNVKDWLPVVTRAGSEDDIAYYDRYVTEENRTESIARLQKTTAVDREIRNILIDARIDPSTLAAVDAIRENPDVRDKVSRRLAQKLDDLIIRDPSNFGDRIVDNFAHVLKQDRKRGGSRFTMPSHMHTVNLALKLIGGEFSTKQSELENDYEQDSSGRVVRMQHTDAAFKLLGLSIDSIIKNKK